MSRNFPVRTALSGVRSCGGPLYGIAGAVCGAPGGRFAGYLSSLTAPLGCARGSIPTLDASRVSQQDELIVCVLLSGCASGARANSVSIPAVRNRRDAARTRKLKKAAGRGFFIFIANDLGDESQSGHYRLRETPNVVRFQTTIRLYLLPARYVKTFLREGAYRRQRFSACRCRQSSSPWSVGQRRHQLRNASGQSAEVRLLSR